MPDYEMSWESESAAWVALLEDLGVYPGDVLAKGIYLQEYPDAYTLQFEVFNYDERGYKMFHPEFRDDVWTTTIRLSVPRDVIDAWARVWAI